MVIPALARLREEGFRFRARFVGAGNYRASGLDAEYVPWSLERDVSAFQEVDIGLAPMFDGPWYEGKCAFKQVQYMTVGVPHVSSWVGGARDILIHGENALVARTADEWYPALRSLLTDVETRRRLSISGRALVERELCAEVQAVRVADAIEGVLAARSPA
jgi:glycosyltransferase involved in cell wall biosynthesis